MIDKQELLDFQRKIQCSRETIDKENLEFFISFLKERGFKQVLKVYPDTDEPVVVFKFCKDKRPELQLSDVVSLIGSNFVPFCEDFISNMSDLIHSLHDTLNDTGICTDKEYNSNDDSWSYLFWISDFYPDKSDS